MMILSPCELVDTMFAIKIGLHTIPTPTIHIVLEDLEYRQVPTEYRVHGQRILLAYRLVYKYSN